MKIQGIKPGNFNFANKICHLIAYKQLEGKAGSSIICS